MGVLVYDSTEVPFKGITVSDFVISCGGTYYLNKIVFPLENKVNYYATTTLTWKTETGNQPIYTENLTVEIPEADIDSANVFAVIYDKVKERYTNYLDV